MAKDVIGNELRKGDLVNLTLPGNQVIGKIGEIKSGGLTLATKLMPGSQMVNQPGTVTLSFQLTVNLNAHGVADGIVKVHDPEESLDCIQ